MKCLLISPQSNACVTGLKYISANIIDKGHDARILLLPGYLEPVLDPETDKFIRDYNPDLIGISLMSLEYYPSKNLTFLIKQKFEIPVIWGGVHVTTNPDECIKYADYICLGEGESAIVSLLEHLQNNTKDVAAEIPGIWSNINGEITKQPDRHPEIDLDTLPHQEYLPDYFYGLHDNKIINFSDNPDIFRKYALYGGMQHMMLTTRGCPYDCGYCANTALSKVYGRRVRARSVENCINELIEVKKNPYVLYINFEDDCFFVHSREWIKKFCDEYKKLINLPFIVRVIPTMLDREKLLILREAGLCMVVMGIQTGSDRVNSEIYQRKVKFSSVMKAAEIISESGAAPYYEMIVDNPYETEEDQIESINAMSKLKKPYTISLAHLTFFPGTVLTEKALKEKIIDPDAYLSRYMVNIDLTYFNKLLYLTPYISSKIIGNLNKPSCERGSLHLILTSVLFFLVKRTVEPAVFFFVITRGLKYNFNWTVRTITGTWKSAVAKILFNFLGKTDMEFNRKLALARKTMPALFEK